MQIIKFTEKIHIFANVKFKLFAFNLDKCRHIHARYALVRLGG